MDFFDQAGLKNSNYTFHTLGNDLHNFLVREKVELFQIILSNIESIFHTLLMISSRTENLRSNVLRQTVFLPDVFFFQKKGTCRTLKGRNNGLQTRVEVRKGGICD